MLSFALLAIACAAISTHAQGEGILVSDNKTQCVNQFVEWCNSMRYPQQGAGLAVLSVTYNDPKGSYRVFCVSDSDGTNCTRNKASWFACSQDHTLTYKGQVLTDTSTNVDEDICETVHKALNDLFVQNLSYDNTTLKTEFQKGMEGFFEQIAEMEEQIASIQKMMKRIPAVRDFWDGFDDDYDVKFRAPRPDLTTPASDDKRSSTEQANQIERE